MLRAQLATVTFATLNLFSAVAHAGPFAPAAGQPGSTAIAKADAQIIGWATTVEQFARGPQDISNPSSPPASAGAATDAIGNNSGVVSLGDAGSITLGFALPITNGPGFDFAVFENGFASGSLAFLELAFVEVSSNGSDFFRFSATSLTPTATQTGSFGLTDPTNLNNLAGKYTSGFGTPFDLAELAAASPLLDINNIQFVRLIDVIGSINPLYAAHDAQGNIINDPWPTAFASSGFDLDAIGVMHQVPEPSSAFLIGLALLLSIKRLHRIKPRCE